MQRIEQTKTCLKSGASLARYAVQVEKAVAIFNTMRAEGCQMNTVPSLALPRMIAASTSHCVLFVRQGGDVTKEVRRCKEMKCYEQLADVGMKCCRSVAGVTL